MKYKLLKYIEPEEISIKIWDTFDSESGLLYMDNWLKITCKALIEQGFIEEVKETPKQKKPKWKIGERVVFDCNSGEKKYIRLFEIQTGKTYFYNKYYTESELRDPTEEELKLYYH